MTLCIIDKGSITGSTKNRSQLLILKLLLGTWNFTKSIKLQFLYLTLLILLYRNKIQGNLLLACKNCVLKMSRNLSDGRYKERIFIILFIVQIPQKPFVDLFN